MQHLSRSDRTSLRPTHSPSVLAESIRIALAGAVSVAISTSAFAQDASVSREEFEALAQRLEKLEQENRRLRGIENEALHSDRISPSIANQSEAPTTGLVSFNSDYNFKVLDHAENTNTKQILQLRAIQNGELTSDVVLGGQVTALANYQTANENSKFGWLMRHPTSSNQIGKSVSEAVVHSANLSLTGKLGNDFTAFIDLLYNPEQSFGAGASITGLTRNILSARRAYVMWGNLDKTPVYASIGKMDIPFGLNDTVNPFTNSTNWHSFGGLAYGGLVGYAEEGLHVRAMAIQGGAQFRNANTPVEGTNVPSKLNNFAFDANYDSELAADTSLMLGASYQYGTGYCQNYVDTPESAHSTFPAFLPAVTRNTAPQGVVHFANCPDNVDAIGVYARFQSSRLQLIAEIAQTLDDWPGTANPYIPEFEAEGNTTFTLGARYDVDFGLAKPIALSAEFSRFEAGAKGSSWEKQDQAVIGASYFFSPNVNIFAEAIHVDGWVPFNFVGGGNPGGLVAESWSSQTSNTDVITFGLQTAF